MGLSCIAFRGLLRYSKNSDSFRATTLPHKRREDHKVFFVDTKDILCVLRDLVVNRMNDEEYYAFSSM